MSARVSSTVASQSYRPPTSSRFAWLASAVFCAALPAVALITLFSVSIYDGSDAIDFRQFYRGAEDVLNGENPYPSSGDPLTASGACTSIRRFRRRAIRSRWSRSIAEILVCPPRSSSCWRFRSCSAYATGGATALYSCGRR
jgi:hypothetical protein